MKKVTCMKLKMMKQEDEMSINELSYEETRDVSEAEEDTEDNESTNERREKVSARTSRRTRALHPKIHI